LSRIELSSDPTIRSHLAALYDTLLEQNLLRIVEPYSVVEIEYVAQQVGQGRQAVEAKSVITYFLFIRLLG
jgi:26S proteasome regulatory subunit N6